MISTAPKTNVIAASRIDSLHQYDLYTYKHSLRVALLAARLAKDMSCDHQQVNTIYLAALMHDIGKVYLPKDVLNKPNWLSQEERVLVQSHAILGYMLLNKWTVFDHLKDIVLHHHERYDGGGYPHGLKRNRIPLGARIIAVADTFDALTSTRVYHQPLHVEGAMMEIYNNAYRMYDPAVVIHLAGILSASQKNGVKRINL